MGGNDWSFTRLAFTALLMLLHPKETSSFVGSTVCQSDHFTYKKVYQRGSSFAINGNPVDRIHFCEAMLIHKAKGCVLGDSFRDLCYLLGMGFFSENYFKLLFVTSYLTELLHLNCLSFNAGGRRFLEEKHVKDSENNEAESENRHVKVSLAASGFLLFCCAICCPCFHKERKANSHEVLPKESNSGDLIY